MENGLKFVVCFVIAIISMILINVFKIEDPTLSYWFGILSVVVYYFVNKYLVPILVKKKNEDD